MRRGNRKKTISARDLLSGTLPAERVAGKLVLIGTSAAGLFDVKSTPLHPFIPGVEVHAQLLDAILTKSHLSRPNYALGAELILMAAVGVILIAAVPALGALRALILGFIIAAALVEISWFSFSVKSLLIDAAYPMMGGLVIYIYLVFHNYFQEEAKRRQVRDAFRQYLAPALVDQLAENPDRLVLGGETRTMSFLFCDVAGFTTISERFGKDPQGLTRFMNRPADPPVAGDPGQQRPPSTSIWAMPSWPFGTRPWTMRTTPPTPARRPWRWAMRWPN